MLNVSDLAHSLKLTTSQVKAAFGKNRCAYSLSDLNQTLLGRSAEIRNRRCTQTSPFVETPMATHLQGTKPVCPYSRPTSCGQFAKGRPHLQSLFVEHRYAAASNRAPGLPRSG